MRKSDKNGVQLLGEQWRAALAGLAISAALMGLAVLLALAGIHTAGAQGPIYAARGQLMSFDIHVISGLALPLALVTQVSVRMRKRRPAIWIGGAVITSILLMVSSATGLDLSITTEPASTRVGLYWSVLLLVLIWAWMLWYFIRGDWFYYRLWAVRATVGLVLQVPFRLFLALAFGLTGDEDFAGSVGYWSALVVSLILVEWVLLPLIWRPKRNVDRIRVVPGTDLVTEGEVGTAMYVIESGAVEVLQERRGDPRRVATLGPGDWFGEIALVRDEPCNATVRATEDVVVTRIDREGFENLFGAVVPLRDAITKTVMQRDGEQIDSRQTLRSEIRYVPH